MIETGQRVTAIDATDDRRKHAKRHVLRSQVPHISLESRARVMGRGRSYGVKPSIRTGRRSGGPSTS